jgi:acetylornithine deacetylase
MSAPAFSSPLANDPELVALLRELVAIPSMNPYRAEALEPGYGEARLAQRVAAFLRDAGLSVELQEIAPGRPNVVARLPGREEGEPLLFVAHLDTVPVQGMTVPPFEGAVREGRLYGRGACDNKGSLAAMLAALRRVAAAKANRSPILFAGTADEESGYRGIRAALSTGVRARAAFVGEPTSLRIVIAHRGVVRWAITTRGTSAHSAHPEQGVNAIYGMAPVVADLEALAAELAKRPAHPLVGPPTLSVGTIHGGLTVNTVPDQCAIEVDRRLIPGESPDDAEAEVRALIERRGAAVERFFAAGAFEVPRDSEAATLATRAVEDVLGKAETVGVAYATEAPEVLAAGIPCVVLGPGDGSKAHSADEFIALDQLEAAERVYERLMAME